MPYTDKPPPVRNRHTERAQRLDRKADREADRGDAFMADHYRQLADKAAAKGGWK